MVQTKCKLNSVEFFLKLFYIQSKEIGNKKLKYYEETRETEKGQSEILPIMLNTLTLERRRLIAGSNIKTKIAFAKD